MTETRKKVLAISGSTRVNSVNIRMIKAIAAMANRELDFTIYDGLITLPYFNPDLDVEPLPEAVVKFREAIREADGVLICTPEYVFSLPGALKNAIEWTVSTTLFLDKPTALITASASGQKAHESLMLIMKTVGARFTEDTSLLISGARAKMSADGKFIDEGIMREVQRLIAAFEGMLQNI